MPTDLILQRIAAADWTDVPEATVCSQLIMPVLMFMGYGQNTLHKVVEQRPGALRHSSERPSPHRRHLSDSLIPKGSGLAPSAIHG
jgi:hypothetical protein